MPRGMTDNTVKRFHLLVETVRMMTEEDAPFMSQKHVAERSGLSQSTISRFINMEPWNVAFSVNSFGRISCTGQKPDFARYTSLGADKVNIQPESKSELLQRLVGISKQNENAIKEGYSQGNPLPVLARSVGAYLGKLQGTPDPNNELTSAELAAIMDTLEKFGIELLRLVVTTKSQPHYGNDDWFMDYV